MPTITLPAVRAERILFALLTLPLLTATAYAQISEGSGLGDSGVRNANNSIQGNIYSPSGQRLDRRLQVRISSVRGLDFSTLSDDNGSFNFRRLPGGTYYITVEAGKEYLPANEIVNIIDTFRTAFGQTYAVQIQLKLKPTSGGKPGVLNAGFAGVPKAALDLYENAVKSDQAGNNKRAIELLKEAIRIHPEFMLAYNEMGVQYFKLGHLADAGEALHQAVKLPPESFSTRLNYAIVLFYEKQYQSAGEQLDQALQVNETSARAHLFRGRVFIKLGNFPKAVPELQRAVKLAGGEEINEAHRLLAGIYNEQGNYTLALKELETYLETSPKVKDIEQVRKIVAELRAKAATIKN